MVRHLKGWCALPIAWINPNRLNLGVNCWGPELKSSSPLTQISEGGDGCWQWIQISALSNHFLLMVRHWKGWADVNCLNQPKQRNLGVNCWGPKLKSSPPLTQISGWVVDNEFKSQPCLTYIILMVRHLKGWADVNCLNQPQQTESWCELLLRPRIEIITTFDSEVRWWWWLRTMNFNLFSLVSPFIILIVTHLNGWTDVNCLNQLQQTESW